MMIHDKWGVFFLFFQTCGLGTRRIRGVHSEKETGFMVMLNRNKCSNMRQCRSLIISWDLGLPRPQQVRGVLPRTASSCAAHGKIVQLGLLLGLGYHWAWQFDNGKYDFPGFTSGCWTVKITKMPDSYNMLKHKCEVSVWHRAAGGIQLENPVQCGG